MQYISIDIETTGLNPIEHDIIEFAAIIDEIGSNKPIENCQNFIDILKKIAPTFAMQKLLPCTQKYLKSWQRKMKAAYS